MFVLVLQELPDLLRPPEGSGACMDFADGVVVCVIRTGGNYWGATGAGMEGTEGRAGECVLLPLCW